MSEQKKAPQNFSDIPQELIPNWMTNEGYSVVSGILLNREALQRGSGLVVTRLGLERFGGVFRTEDGLVEEVISV